MATNGSPRARALSAALREARKERGISLREVARKLTIDQSHLSKIETGKRVPSVETTAMILAVLGTEPGERERILDLAKNASEPNWLTVGMPGIPQQLAGAVESERAASAIVYWSPMIIPGLLQTADYVRAIAMSGDLPIHEVESRVMVRLARREVLSRRNPAKFDMLIGEGVLRQSIGSSDVMLDQLRHLLTTSSEHDNINVRVVPTRVGWHPGTAGPFVLYEFPDSPPFVHFEHYSSGAFVTNSDDIEAYRKAIAMISKYAFSSADSMDFIKRIIVEEYQENDAREQLAQK
ncbi:helix-turn-helix domain-containing protein [Saccharopolyspora spinosa]|uniref:Helix-turn-helix protein n=1 Tax=Saccharopolyspora spinosa TaxID=60894 RepID=A0A2N3XXM3_SACSN|nr:helix-turn-helix transcriptional regulator [Saccharopolyspora spinosa]PKW15379.1 helix-turn-helix protein [Saccharopolyspora spinosa]